LSTALTLICRLTSCQVQRARRRAEIDAGHARRQPRIPLLTRDEMVPGLLQLERRAAGCLARKLQARDAHRPQRTVVRLGDADEYFATALEREQKARPLALLVEAPGLDQRLAQRRLELAAEVGKLLAIVGIQHLQPQAAAHRVVRQVRQQHADAIGFRKLQVVATCPLPRKNQIGEAQPAHQPFGAAGLAADELGTGAVRPRLGIAGDFEDGGVLTDFGTDLAFEPGAAMQQQCIHVRIL